MLLSLRLKTADVQTDEAPILPAVLSRFEFTVTH